MSGVLIYTREQAKRNEFAVKKFTSLLDVRLVDESFRGRADFVINRTNCPQTGRYFEKRGIRVFNPSRLTSLANNKQACYEFMAERGIEIMPVNYAGIPAVKKKNNGSGGSDVKMLTSRETPEKGYVYQMPCDTPGKDLRVWLIGGEIITAIMRESRTDFRANYCLGGSAYPYALNGSETALVKKIAALIKSDYIGIDFIFHRGRAIFNEIEDAVGARMVYDKTDIDILALYCEYIKNNI